MSALCWVRMPLILANMNAPLKLHEIRSRVTLRIVKLGQVKRGERLRPEMEGPPPPGQGGQGGQGGPPRPGQGGQGQGG